MNNNSNNDELHLLQDCLRSAGVPLALVWSMPRPRTIDLFDETSWVYVYDICGGGTLLPIKVVWRGGDRDQSNHDLRLSVKVNDDDVCGVQLLRLSI